MADWMNVPYLQTRYGGKAPPRVGLRHPSIAPYGAFACSDGKQILLSIQNDREWRILCEKLLGNASLADDPRYARNVDRVANSEAIEKMIGDVLCGIAREDAMRLLNEAGIACGRLSTMEDMLAHPQAQMITVDSPTGPVEMMGRGTQVSGQRNSLGAVPALGADSEKLRKEFAASLDKKLA
jgi:crotonobetainyl-CoA:carnitine CoA-transferase CaiB-like acyl-CoA transferase